MEELIRWDHTYQALRDYAETVRQIYKDNLYILGHIASGKLASSIDYIVEMDMARIEVTLRLEDYWKYVEYDTKPHFPPYKAILDWVKVKFHGNLPNIYDGKLPSTETLEKQFAYLTQQKIGREGTEGTHALQDAIDSANAQFESIIDKALQEDIDEGINTILLAAFGEK